MLYVGSFPSIIIFAMKPDRSCHLYDDSRKSYFCLTQRSRQGEAHKSAACPYTWRNSASRWQCRIDSVAPFPHCPWSTYVYVFNFTWTHFRTLRVYDLNTAIVSTIRFMPVVFVALCILKQNSEDSW